MTNALTYWSSQALAECVVRSFDFGPDGAYAQDERCTISYLPPSVRPERRREAPKSKGGSEVGISHHKQTPTSFKGGM